MDQMKKVAIVAKIWTLDRTFSVNIKYPGTITMPITKMTP